ncbi:S8 family serine peptidase [Exiguobacterium sp. S3]|uniref:S8 family peptidase n=1 Tax=Exiguobacterium sp. S3 TaxID=483245 RepID=UPI001BEB652E|nr:S8 family serine peptidase [Exiguobacterium sp. S3]
MVQLKPLVSKTKTENELNELSRQYAQSIVQQGELPKFTSESNLKVNVEAKKIKENMENTSAHTIGPNENSIEQNVPMFFNLDDPSLSPFNWYLMQTVDGQYGITDRGFGTSVALIDSGVDINHPLLKDHLDLNHAKNYVNDNQNVNDDMGHGTSVAAVMANIAPQTKITPYKVLDKVDGESIWVLEAIIDATNHQNDVINLSLGTYKNSNIHDEAVLIKAYERAIEYAEDNGTIVVALSGNRAENLDKLKKSKTVHLPGSIKNVITVSATNINTQISSYSNTGKNVDFTAPGGDLDEKSGLFDLIVSAYPFSLAQNELDAYVGMPEGYTLTYGTSIAAPQVSATILVVKSRMTQQDRKKVSNKSVIKVLKKSVIDLGSPGRDDLYGYGQINLRQTLDYLQ